MRPSAYRTPATPVAWPQEGCPDSGAVQDHERRPLPGLDQLDLAPGADLDAANLELRAVEDPLLGSPVVAGDGDRTNPTVHLTEVQPTSSDITAGRVLGLDVLAHEP